MWITGRAVERNAAMILAMFGRHCGVLDSTPLYGGYRLIRTLLYVYYDERSCVGDDNGGHRVRYESLLSPVCAV